MDRRQILIALARSGHLTPDRQMTVRGADHPHVRALLVEIGASADACAAAGLPVIRRTRGRPPSAKQIQQQVDLNLALLGLPSAAIAFTTIQRAEGKSLDRVWYDALRTDQTPYQELPYPHLPQRVVQILVKRSDPIWAPLAGLIDRKVYPFGLTLDQDAFLIAMAG